MIARNEGLWAAISACLDKIITYILGCCGLLASVTLADINEILNFILAVLSIAVLIYRLRQDMKKEKKKRKPR